MIVRGKIARSRKRTANTTGQVVRVKLRGSSVVVPSPDIAFFDRGGVRHEFKSSVGFSRNPWPVGSQVKVRYDPDDPANAALASSEISLPLVEMLVIVGMMLAIVGTFAVINALGSPP
jgi:hypothetical protein